MKNQFHALKISDIRRETPDCVSIALDVPASLKKEFNFKPGQYLTFKQNLNGEEVRRSYSICSAPAENEWRVAVKKLDGGAFSTFANEKLKVGDTLETMTPDGRFFLEAKKQQKKNYVMIAAGSGITPILSQIKTIMTDEPQSTVTLIYGNKTKGTIIFKNEIEALKNRYLTRMSVYHVLSRERAEAEFLAGRIDSEKCEYLINKLVPIETIDDVYICGPEEMILATRDVLQKNGLAVDKIHFELFFSAKSQAKKSTAKITESDTGEKSKITLKLDGVETVFDLGFQGENILDAAMKNGVDLPFACKGGVCATCRAKVEVGQVEMDVNYSLAPDELAAGYVLTCQSHPRTKVVRVNFDIK